MKAYRILCILGALCVFQQTIEALRILAIFPIAGQSHFNPFAKLGKALAEKGHQVDVYSHFPLKNPISNYKDYSLAGSLPQFTNNMSFQFVMMNRAPTMGRLQTMIGETVCSLLDGPVFQNLIKNPPQDPPYDVIINEVFFQNCFIALKRHLNIPMVGVSACALFESLYLPLGIPYNTAVDTGFFTGYEHPMSFYERLMNTIKYYKLVMSYRYYAGAQDRVIERNFGPGYPNSADIVKDVDMLLVNSHHSLELIRAYTPNVIQVAGLHIDSEDKTPLPKVVKQWLDDSKDGCIYVSFGSMMRIETLPNSTLDAFYATFENIVPVRVLMKIAKPEDLPPGLPSNVLTQTWLSQVQILKHKNVRAFVTHGGLLGTTESIFFGVPMIGFPLFGDQPWNIRQYVKKGIAVELDIDNVTEELFTNAVKRVVHNPTYKNNIMALSRKFSDRPMKPIDTAIFWIEYMARHGPNALRPPIIDLPWCRAHLLDVYGFLWLCVISFYYIIKFVLKKLFALVMNDKKSQEMQSKKRK